MLWGWISEMKCSTHKYNLSYCTFHSYSRINDDLFPLYPLSVFAFSIHFKMALSTDSINSNWIKWKFDIFIRYIFYLKCKWVTLESAGWLTEKKFQFHSHTKRKLFKIFFQWARQIKLSVNSKLRNIQSI